jgi:L-glyceraldehyde 3-phosphate reductase
MFDDARYDGRMPFRRCGDSGLLLPAISLGCWHNFGGVDDFDESRRILHRAFDRGVTHFDLANNYGPPPGSAEENVGRILASDFICHRDELIISTKAGHDMWQGPYGMNGSRKHLLSSLDQSLKRLQLDYVDIFYSHCPDPNTRLEETMSALATKYPLKRLKDAVKILKDMGIRCLIYQPPYSILQRDYETNGIIDWLHQEGIGNIVFSPLAQGMLTPKYLDGIPDGSRAARPEGFLKTEQVLAAQKKIRALGKLAAEHSMSLHHLAMRWALRNDKVTSAIIGARTVDQLNDTLDSINGTALSESLLHAIDEMEDRRS